MDDADQEVRALVQTNLRLAGFAVNRLLRSWPELLRLESREDLLAWGHFALLRAARDYDPARGTAFSTLAMAYLQSELTNRARYLTAKRRCLPTMSLHRLPRSLEPEDPRPGPEARAILAETWERAWGAWNTRERAVMTWRFVEGQVLEEVGARLGVTKERARQIEARALRRAREALGVEEPAQGRCN